MTAAWYDEKIKLFVKDTLGCGCPEKVFEKIDVSKLLKEELGKDITRIVVGDTLLIYIVRPELSDDFVDRVETIGLAGKVDRDSHDYNRFRLVVSGFKGDGQQGEAVEHFSALFKTDDKMHLHFVDQGLVDGLS